MRGEQILCRRSAARMEFHSHIIPYIANVISHAGPSSQSGSDVITVRLRMCVICACRRILIQGRLDRVRETELRYKWARNEVLQLRLSTVTAVKPPSS